MVEVGNNVSVNRATVGTSAEPGVEGEISEAARRIPRFVNPIELAVDTLKHGVSREPSRAAEDSSAAADLCPPADVMMTCWDTQQRVTVDSS